MSEKIDVIKTLREMPKSDAIRLIYNVKNYIDIISFVNIIYMFDFENKILDERLSLVLKLYNDIEGFSEKVNKWLKS